MANEQGISHQVSGVSNEDHTGNILAYWQRRLSGKRVCIVGNAPSLEIPHPPIDQHDIVIRFNDCIRGGSWGTKISFYCTTLRKEVRTDPEYLRAEGIPVVFTGPQPSGNYELTWDFAGQELARSLGCWPSSGLMAVYITCACKAAHVTLSAMALAYPIVREPSWGPRYAPPCYFHNFLGERRVLAGLIRTFDGSIDLPPALSALRLGAFDCTDWRWETLASALTSVSRVGQSYCTETDIEKGKLPSHVQDLLHEVTRELSTLRPSMEGVRHLESFFHLSTDKHLHRERWLLFHPLGVRLMDDLLCRLRKLQTL